MCFFSPEEIVSTTTRGKVALWRWTTTKDEVSAPEHANPTLQ
jgi:hypothetical protein